MTQSYTKKDDKFGKIPSGAVSDDFNVSQGFSTAETHLSQLGADMNNINEKVDNLRTEIINEVSSAVTLAPDELDTVANGTTLQNAVTAINSLTTAINRISTNLKSLS